MPLGHAIGAPSNFCNMDADAAIKWGYFVFENGSSLVTVWHCCRSCLISVGSKMYVIVPIWCSCIMRKFGLSDTVTGEEPNPVFGLCSSPETVLGSPMFLTIARVS